MNLSCFQFHLQSSVVRVSPLNRRSVREWITCFTMDGDRPNLLRVQLTGYGASAVYLKLWCRDKQSNELLAYDYQIHCVADTQHDVLMEVATYYDAPST